MTDADGRVVLAGFIKIEIAKQVNDIVTDIFNKGTHNFGCDEADAILTWSEISYQLLRKQPFNLRMNLMLYMNSM